MRAHRRVAFRAKRQQNKMGMFLVTMVVFMMLVVVSIKSYDLIQRQKEYDVRISALNEELATEEKRTEEIEEFKKYTKTKAYIEEVAKDKLGLVRDGEIIFKTDN